MYLFPIRKQGYNIVFCWIKHLENYSYKRELGLLFHNYGNLHIFNIFNILYWLYLNTVLYIWNLLILRIFSKRDEK